MLAYLLAQANKPGLQQQAFLARAPKCQVANCLLPTYMGIYVGVYIVEYGCTVSPGTNIPVSRGRRRRGVLPTGRYSLPFRCYMLTSMLLYAVEFFALTARVCITTCFTLVHLESAMRRCDVASSAPLARSRGHSKMLASPVSELAGGIYGLLHRPSCYSCAGVAVSIASGALFSVHGGFVIALFTSIGPSATLNETMVIILAFIQHEIINRLKRFHCLYSLS